MGCVTTFQHLAANSVGVSLPLAGHPFECLIGFRINMVRAKRLLWTGGMTVAGQMAEYGHLRPAFSGCGRLSHLQITLTSRIGECGKTFKQGQGICLIG